MNKYLFPIYAVIIGFVFVRLTKSRPWRHIKLLLAFSGAFLLSITVFELLPEVYQNLEPRKIGLYIMIGILFQIFLEFFSKGAEHGHIHKSSENAGFPWLLFISLCIHALMEGFPINQHNDMVYGVLIHKIPIAILITSYLYQSNFKSWTIAAFLLVFAAMTPLGTWISNEVAIDAAIVSSISAVVIGIFFHISTIILFESSQGHRFNLRKIIVITTAVAIAYFI
ncbi:MAG: ZIP family metal transporter [Bacteroidia bacterium]|nr:ZIP family metal transporter [Bacteroidia bacterium]NNK68835.1 ZIP family metal transporter [Flavobacteriaceae bacterium]